MIPRSLLPMGWDLVPLRRVLAKQTRPVLESDGVVTAYRDGQVTLRELRRDDGYTMSDKEAGYQGVDPGDFVFHALDGFAGAVGVSEAHGKCSPVYHVCAASLGDDPRFLTYAVRAAAWCGYLEAQAPNTRQRSVDFRNWESFGRMVIPHPAPSAQRRIADFLDDQVSRIDRAIDRRERQRESLVDLLRSVLEGEYGEAAFGSVDHRSLRSLCAYFQDGDWIESPFIVEDGVRLIQTGNVGVGRYREQGFRYVSDAMFVELRCKEVLPGDVLISRLGSPVSRACVAPGLGSRMLCSVDVVIARPNESILSDYLVQFLSSPESLSNSDMLSRGATMQRLSRSQVGSLRIPLIPVSEQREKVKRVGEFWDQHDELMMSIEAGALLLLERKRALITAAVTGALDVTTASGRGAA